MKKLCFLVTAVITTLTMYAQSPTVSSAKVSLTYCRTTYGEKDVQAAVPCTVDGFNFTEYGDFLRLLPIPNAAGCDSMVTYHISYEPQAENMLPGKFKVNADGKYVQFAMGNLKYQASGTAETYYDPINNPSETHHETADGVKQGIWEFHAEQYGMITEEAVNSANAKPQRDQNKWVDMFCWASSGYQYQPYSMTESAADVTTLSGTNHDWGEYNAIANGGNKPGQWRTLTKAEWEYLLNHHTWAFGSIAVGIAPGIGGGNTAPGLFVLPENWVEPYDGFEMTSGSTGYSFSVEQWKQMEANGALFLLATSYRTSTNIAGNGHESLYWTADGSQEYNTHACFVGLNSTTNKIQNSEEPKTDGAYIRLVVDCK